ncbi:TPA: NAD(+)--arginine ADP-ribosyltransferase [Vibrio cholerae]|nr:NAD(+)--arginine ADP-ribosyltransferase [Vibrio cholerae]
MKTIISLIFIMFPLFVSAHNGNFYRADSRSPNEIKDLGGLYPRGYYDFFERGTPMSISLYDHARGAPSGNTRYDDGFVSTTTDIDSAHEIGQNILSGYTEYYIYLIAPAPNLLDVNAVLGRYSPHPQENEYSALGGIPWTQVIGWYVVNNGVLDRNIHRNRQFRADLFNNLSPALPSESYQFAGFEPEHPAWRQEPWINFAPPGCGRNVRLTKHINQQDCSNSQEELVYKKLQDLRTQFKVDKKLKLVNKTSSNNIIFPNHDFIREWVDLDGNGDLSYCGFTVDSDGSRKRIVCAHNNGNFTYSSINISLSDYGWPKGQRFIDANGDGLVDYCRVQHVWTHLYCSLSLPGQYFSLDKDAGYLDAGYNNSRAWAKVIGTNKYSFCRLTSNGYICTDIDSYSTAFKDDDQGWADSRYWMDIDGNGGDDYCRLVYNWTHLRCNLQGKDGLWKRVESKYLDGGYPSLRFKIKMTSNKDNYCRIVRNHRVMECAYVSDNGEFHNYSLNMPFSLYNKNDIQFIDIDGDNRDDICRYNSAPNTMECYLNQDKSFSQNKLVLYLSAKPISSLGSGSSKIIRTFNSEKNSSAYCYNAGYGTLRCDEFVIY